VLTDRIPIRRVRDVRRTIGTRTPPRAALRRDDARAARLTAQAPAIQGALDDSGGWMENDRAFHEEITAAGNPVLALIAGAFDGVTRRTWPTGSRSWTGEGQRRAMLDLHVEIAGAIEDIEDGDPARASDPIARHRDGRAGALVAAGIS
jgi:DNA-binding FadR family transcriptional regulator